jgi:hypothetical protein
VALGSHDNRRIRQSDLKVAVLPRDFSGASHIGRLKALQLMRAARDFAEHRYLRVRANVTGEQVVEFRKDERRQKEWLRSLFRGLTHTHGGIVGSRPRQPADHSYPAESSLAETSERRIDPLSQSRLSAFAQR